MPEHTPLTDAKMLIMQRDAEVAGDSKKPYATDVLRLATDLREARRLLRAVEWQEEATEKYHCPVCKQGDAFGHAPHCDLGRYLVAVDGKGEK